MDIKTTLEKYKILGKFFAPDYKRKNHVLTEFKKSNPNLTKEQTVELVDLLDNSTEVADSYFVADLLYLYDNFDKELFEPLINTGINHKDPSFNRIFLRPCLANFGSKVVADYLADKFNKVDIEERIGISKLIYWLRPKENGEAEKLKTTILEKASETTNPIELYHYKLCYSDKIKDSDKIPNNADDLVKAILGNNEYENLLFNKLGWRKSLTND